MVTTQVAGNGILPASPLVNFTDLQQTILEALREALSKSDLSQSKQQAVGWGSCGVGYRCLWARVRLRFNRINQLNRKFGLLQWPCRAHGAHSYNIGAAWTRGWAMAWVSSPRGSCVSVRVTPYNSLMVSCAFRSFVGAWLPHSACPTLPLLGLSVVYIG